ncbi:Solute carrier family 25 member 38-like protein [Dinothrombium tinctorium]|uniref:Mitochondrial glycine transporter n=1 Tax=Dinothrombium tinctorium TaxID=1965070 RepID=A0A443QYA3_9ACAR|nr:Solute carrier family 25 member 38-like protein [Dinothrombium tinctorium]RWS07500.1 Solute carrier family 25 member 38-like protein [Dinothrombium tinctorium]RWS08017.1 Solute carrier family 25 member 38-like protein [Dinothrombium tinctorium]
MTKNTELYDILNYGQNLSNLDTGEADTWFCHPIVKSFMIGSISGTSSTILFQPLDLIKTRMQNECIARKGRMISIVINTIKNENVTGLWKGTVPSLLRCVPGIGIYFSSLHWMQSNLVDAHRDPNAFEAIILGVLARSVAGTILMPFTVIKTRFESGIFQYASISEAIKMTYFKEGARGLFKGLTPTLLRDAPFSGLYYMFYSQLKNLVDSKQSPSLLSVPPSLRPVAIFSCGLSAGLLSSIVTHPADVFKTKMQLQPTKHRNLINTVIIVVKEQGIQAFFVGLVPRMIRRTLMASMAWTVYDSLMQNIGLK